jgi:S1-C subfamily serine protease
MRTAVTEGFSENADIFVGDQPMFSLKPGEAIAYTYTTETTILVNAKIGKAEIIEFLKLKIKKGKEYYLWMNKEGITEVYREDVKSFLNERSDKIIFKEEINNPNLQFEKPNADHSMLYIVRDNKFYGSTANVSMFLGNQAPFNIASGQVIGFKIYSEGEVPITAQIISSGVGNYHCTLKVARGNEYFVYVGIKEVKEIDKTYLEGLFKERTGMVLKKEENKDKPINYFSDSDNKGKGQGTCFLISAEGYFVTNNHCIEGAKEINVRGLNNDFTVKYEVKVVGTDPSNDLALLKLVSKEIKLTPPVFGIRSIGVSQAEKIYAMGYPKAWAMGEEIKVTDGIISSRSGVNNDISKFQISAAVNAGNSGGPLIDESGNVIGVIYAKSTIAESAGYAIKASYLETFLKNVEGFNYPNFVNSIMNKPLTEKIKELKNFIYIVETN